MIFLFKAYPKEFYPSLDDPVILEARGLFTLSNDAARKGKLDESYQ